MLIKKTYHFYAAHRNEMLPDKCKNIHGHRYGVTCWFDVERQGDNVSVLFSVFDEIGQYLQRVWDHAHIINRNDPLFSTLRGCGFKQVILPRPASVENVCHRLFHDILIEMEFNLVQIEVQETDSSTICYTLSDYYEDEKLFNPGPGEKHVCDFSDRSVVKCPTCGKTRYEFRIEQKRAASQPAAPGDGTVGADEDN